MQLTHLLCLAQTHLAHLLQICLGLRLNGNLDDWVREVHALQNDGVLIIAECLSCEAHSACMFEEYGRLSRTRYGLFAGGATKEGI